MSVTRNLYHRFTSLTQAYPVNVARSRKDFGKFVRGPVLAEQFLKQPESEQEATIDALSKLSSNYYKNKYQRMSEHAYTNISRDDLREFLDLVETEEYRENMESKTFKEKMTNMYTNIMRRGKK